MLYLSILCQAYLLSNTYGLIRNAKPGQKATIALSAEKRLIKDLIETYKQAGTIGRPVRNFTEAITVTYGLALVQILNLDEKNQVLTISAWNRFVWRDYLLSWNRSDYNGVEIVRVPVKDIWRPDVVLYNYADDRLVELRETFAVLSYTGEVLWIPQAIYKSSCSIDITNFPYDSQICHLKFGSWTFDGWKLDLQFYEDKAEVSLNDYVPSNEWDLLASPARRNVIYYPCCKEPFPDLTFTLVIKRQVAFYSYILILPCVLLSLLTMVLFWLPPESPAKMQLGMNIFVAFFLLLLLLTDNTPPAASAIPVIGAYYCLNMIMITISTFLAVCVIHLYFRGPRTNKVPPWLHKAVLVGLAKLVFMTNYVPNNKQPIASDVSNKQKLKNSKNSRTQKSLDNCEVKELGDDDSVHNMTVKSINKIIANPAREAETPDMSPVHLNQGLETDVREIKRYIKTYLYTQKKSENLEKIRGEWRAVALILDRFFFFLYITSIIVSLATMFPRGT